MAPKRRQFRRRVGDGEMLRKLVDALTRHIQKLCGPEDGKEVGSLRLIVGPVSTMTVEKREQITMASLILTDVQECPLTVAPVDAKGNPAVLQGVPVWTSTDPTIISVEASQDGLSAVVAAVGKLGTAQVDINLDGVSGVLDVEVRGSDAVSLAINAGTPVVIPPPNTTDTTTTLPPDQSGGQPPTP